MKKILFSILAAVLFVGTIMPVPGAESKLKSYYGGDAISYKGHVIVGTASTGALELYKMDSDNKLIKFASLRTVDPRFGTQVDFTDMMFKVESGKLFVYAVEPRSIFKYDASDLNKASLVSQAKDNSWDWFAELDDVSGNVATIGYKGVKIWNNNLQIIDSFDVKNPEYQYNITSAQSDKFLFNIASGKVSIFDKESRKVVKQFDITKQWENRSYRHQIYNDKVDNAIYIADDSAVKKFNLNGEIEKSFKYTGPFGYDITPSYDARYVYFSNGIGIVKLRKEDLSVVSYIYTSSVANYGGWAMGLKVVKTAEGEKVIVFNNSNILVLDSNLKTIPSGDFNIAFVASTEEDSFPEIVETLFLNVDKNRAPANTQILLSGGGFGRNESLRIEFAESVIDADAGLDGRFSKVITVPNVSARRTDIKVIGLDSNLKYNIGFQIE